MGIKPRLNDLSKVPKDVSLAFHGTKKMVLSIMLTRINEQKIHPSDKFSMTLGKSFNPVGNGRAHSLFLLKENNISNFSLFKSQCI